MTGRVESPLRRPETARLPEFFLDDVDERLAIGTAQHRRKYVGIGGDVVEVRAGRNAAPECRGPLIEILAIVDDRPVHVPAIRLPFEMEEADARGHHHYVTNRSLAVGRARELRRVFLDRIVEALDRAIVQGHADDGRRKTLAGRPDMIAAFLIEAFAVILEANLAIAQDHEARDIGLVQVMRQRVGIAIELVEDLVGFDRIAPEFARRR